MTDSPRHFADSWVVADRKASDEANDEIDGRDLLSDEDELDRELGADELFAAGLGSELLNSEIDAEEANRAADEEECMIGRQYALVEISGALQTQLDDMTSWRTEVESWGGGGFLLLFFSGAELFLLFSGLVRDSC